MKLLKFLAVLTIAFAQLTWANSVEISEQWVREAPPNARVLAAFMVIDNQSPESQTLVSVSCDDFERVEMHQTVEHDGMMHMNKQEKLVIESKQQLILKPGSYHLMLMGIKRPLRAGDEVELTLKFANDTELVVKTPVRKSSSNKKPVDNH
ncbi:MAG: copper chaperone PCu(A)C [Proteobacteria bacterium]|nr:copper chaperone PCu(A)C [Pseudomonadota bacterium]